MSNALDLAHAVSRSKEGLQIVFGRSLENDASRSVRHRLLGRFGERALSGAVRVDSFFDLADRVCELPSDVSDRTDPPYYVLLDLQRIVLFHDTRKGGNAGISSLVRHMIDGYPLQPFEHFAANERNGDYLFGFDCAALEIVPLSLSRLAPGEYSLVDLLTGELLRAPLQRHPRGGAPPLVAPPASEPAERPALGEAVSDRSLRCGPPPGLGDLIDRTAGIIRRDEPAENFVSLACSMASVSSNRGSKQEYCFGVTVSPQEARLVARCEAAERYQIGKMPPNIELVRGTYNELADRAIDPRSLFIGRSPACPEDEGAPFDPDMPLCWTWAWGQMDDRWRLVPAQEVWYDAPFLLSEPRVSIATTSGCAVGGSLEEASLFALLEAVERDAFLTSWYLQRPAVEIDQKSFQNDHLCDLLERIRLVLPGYAIVLYDLTSDVGVPSIGALAIREEGKGPRVLASSAAHIDAEKACLRALKELLRFRSWPELSADRLEEIRRRAVVPATPDGHFELYALDDSFSALDYLQLGKNPAQPVQNIGRNSPIPDTARIRQTVALDLLAQRLRELGADLYIKDMTHPVFAERGLKIARVVTPGLYPMWFGSKSRRFGVTGRLRRLARDYVGRPFHQVRLQLSPHPMP